MKLCDCGNDAALQFTSGWRCVTCILSNDEKQVKQIASLKTLNKKLAAEMRQGNRQMELDI